MDICNSFGRVTVLDKDQFPFFCLMLFLFSYIQNCFQSAESVPCPPQPQPSVPTPSSEALPDPIGEDLGSEVDLEGQHETPRSRWGPVANIFEATRQRRRLFLEEQARTEEVKIFII